jgi:hypothetical protein
VNVQRVSPAWTGDGLDGFRANAPDLRRTLPSGRAYTSPPPPALGLGSQDHEGRCGQQPAVPVAEPFSAAELDALLHSGVDEAA